MNYHSRLNKFRNYSNYLRLCNNIDENFACSETCDIDWDKIKKETKEGMDGCKKYCNVMYKNKLYSKNQLYNSNKSYILSILILILTISLIYIYLIII